MTSGYSYLVEDNIAYEKALAEYEKKLADYERNHKAGEEPPVKPDMVYKIANSKSIIDAEQIIYDISSKIVKETKKEQGISNKKFRDNIQDQVQRDFNLYLYNLYAMDSNNRLKYDIEYLLKNEFEKHYYKKEIVEGKETLVEHNTFNDKVTSKLTFAEENKTFEKLFENSLTKYVEENENTFTLKGLLNALAVDIEKMRNNIIENNNLTDSEKNNALDLLDSIYNKGKENLNEVQTYGKIATEKELLNYDFDILDTKYVNLKKSLLDSAYNNENGKFVYENHFNEYLKNYEKIELSEDERKKVNDKISEIRTNLFRNFVNKELLEDNARIEKKYSYEKTIEENGSKKTIEVSPVKDYEKIIRDYLDAAQKYRVQHRLILQSEADLMNKIYPHYVPTSREHLVGGSDFGFINSENANKSIRTRDGSDLLIKPLISNILNDTLSTVKKATLQEVGESILKTEGGFKSNSYIEIDPENLKVPQVRNVEDIIEYQNKITDVLEDNNVVIVNTFDEQGNRIAKSIRLSDEAMMPIKTLVDTYWLDNFIGMKYVNKANSTFRSLVTEANPFFLGRNMIRDLTDALFTTKNGVAKFSTEYAKTYKELFNWFFAKNKSDNNMLNLFYMNGGFSSTDLAANRNTRTVWQIVEKYSKTIGSSQITWNSINVIDKMAVINELVELAPRYTEFKLSYGKYMQEGKDNALMLALHDSADITTDFTRGGYVAKGLNRTLIPFLNAQIQGASKVYNFTKRVGNTAIEVAKDIRRDGIKALINGDHSKELASILARILLLGFGAEWLFDWLNELIDSETYDAIPNYTKDNYFLIPIGNANYIKIPKGRISGTVQNTITQIIAMSKGEKDIEEAVKDWGDVAMSNLAPIDLGTGIRDIFSPIRDIKNNTTWYGQSIDKQSDLNKYASERYDADTSEIAKAIGKAFNYSPKRIDYLLEQYSGVIGDILIPATTKSTYQTGALNSLTNFVKSNTSINAVSNFKYRGQAYELLNNLLYEKNAGNKTATIMYSYLNRQLDSLQDLEDQIDATSGAEQYALYLTLRQGYKEAIENTNLMSSKLGVVEDIDTNDRTTMTELYRQMFGAEYALSYYNSTAKKKADIANKLGIDYELFYEVYFTVRSCSTKDEAVRYITKSARQNYMNRLVLEYLVGISLTTTEKNSITRYLKRKGIEL